MDIRKAAIEAVEKLADDGSDVVLGQIIQAHDGSTSQMSDATRPRLANRKFIRLNDHDFELWTQELRCSEVELVTAIEAVGNGAESVGAYIARNRRPLRKGPPD